MKKEINNLLIPNINRLPKSKEVKNRPSSDKASEFQNLLKDKIKDQAGIKLSVHAAKRIQERGLNLEGEQFRQIQDAFKQLNNKGGRDSLIITKEGAYIVDVPNKTIVTAIDKENLQENVFTKIDSTIIVND